ncbi:GDP-fucose protein O-fucosyltransferase 1 [Sarcoptes scabiei]|uniref:GDP-fucose protein O-fucosyltransferase 1 n=1 Tax=Sarcoptes scabiei TaxID=52283 RepID=A0A132AM03_SARSC|nr:GDP-fucose protein O-fucosyltransferase 1 [Sarcoptes scabiei]KPM11933.1 GDP-fucose protein O-fucosyltransferase 1-like protein [Sarcoptes scabiei]
MITKKIYYIFFLCLLFSIQPLRSLEIDPNGYIVYCPCMGRFGNQAEQFLGTLQFAKALDRTLILPPFIQYVNYKVEFIPFESLFEIDKISAYHRVISMKNFLANLAEDVWPKSNRSIACYGPRSFSAEKNSDQDVGCNPFEGSPFKDFWSHIGVEEFPSGSLFYKPLHTDFNYASEWKAKFNHIKVLAFVGAPSSFPTNKFAVELSKYIYFTKDVIDNAQKYRENRGFARKPYLGIHLRHGPDWVRACELIHSNPDLKQLFSSQQCLGSPNLNRKINFDLCLPSLKQIVDKIRSSLKAYDNQRSSNNKQSIEYLYIATDHNDDSFWLDLNRTLSNDPITSNLTLIVPSMTFHMHNGTFSNALNHNEIDFISDIYLLSNANLFIGNCISSFTAFISRFRLYRLHFDQTTFFFAHPSSESGRSIHPHQEL